MTLDATLRDLAKRGELTYLSIVPIAGKGGIVFHASYSPASMFGHDGAGRDADPVKAALEAIAQVKLPRVRTRAQRTVDASPLVSDEDLGL